MMMGAGLLFMLLFGLVVISLPLLVMVLVAGGGLAALLKSLSSISAPAPQSSSPVNGGAPPSRKCPTCGRGVRLDWNVCPSCGAALT